MQLTPRVSCWLPGPESARQHVAGVAGETRRASAAAGDRRFDVAANTTSGAMPAGSVMCLSLAPWQFTHPGVRGSALLPCRD